MNDDQKARDMRRALLSVCAWVLLSLQGLPAAAQTNLQNPESISVDDWIEWGTVVHGSFGSHIALGIRIGEDALKRLNAKRRELDVVVTEGAKAPCACVADGVAIATSASAGQRSLSVLPKSDDGSFLAIVDIRSRTDGRSLSYRVPASAVPILAAMNPGKSERQRYDLVMATPAEQLYTIETKEKRP
jgi:formylmethanofuran dehydrogenase subunit E